MIKLQDLYLVRSVFERSQAIHDVETTAKDGRASFSFPDINHKGMTAHSHIKWPKA